MHICISMNWNYCSHIFHLNLLINICYQKSRIIHIFSFQMNFKFWVTRFWLISQDCRYLDYIEFCTSCTWQIFNKKSQFLGNVSCMISSKSILNLNIFCKYISNMLNDSKIYRFSILCLWSSNEWRSRVTLCVFLLDAIMWKCNEDLMWIRSDIKTQTLGKCRKSST